MVITADEMNYDDETGKIEAHGIVSVSFRKSR